MLIYNYVHEEPRNGNDRRLGDAVAQFLYDKYITAGTGKFAHVHLPVLYTFKYTSSSRSRRSANSQDDIRHCFSNLRRCRERRRRGEVAAAAQVSRDEVH